MAEATTTVTFDAPIDKVFEVLVDYESYPEFVDGVSSVNVIEQNEEGATVEYGLNLIKKFKYTLNLEHVRPTSVSWSFDSGDLFKINQGSWELEDNGDGTTEVTYSVELDVKGFFPGSGKIIKTLTSVNLPNMLEAYEKRAQEV